MAAHGPYLARRPYLFGPLLTPIYIEMHIGQMVIIWPSDIYLWTLFGPLWPQGGTQLFFGGCVPRGFQNVGSRERIFLYKMGVFGTKIWKNLGLESWKCKNFLKIENRGAQERHIDGKLVG